MRIFITGTDTNVGKTLVSSWLCMHTGYDYWKPIQTGSMATSDTKIVENFTNSVTHPEVYLYPAPLSPHLAAELQNDMIDMAKITPPNVDNLIIEGAGGVLVPLNPQEFMIDLISKLNAAVIIVAKTELGTINHSLLTLRALEASNIKVLGIIMNGYENHSNQAAIEYYGKTSVLACFPRLTQVDSENLRKIPLTEKLNEIFR